MYRPRLGPREGCEGRTDFFPPILSRFDQREQNRTAAIQFEGLNLVLIADSTISTEAIGSIKVDEFK